ncbi:MAG: HPF/RaiA family ribosome-associated protein [bacterium]
MGIEITVRHIGISAEGKEYAQSKAEELLRDFPNLENVHIIIDGHGHRKLAEVVIQGKPHIRIEASGAADEVLPAVDQALDKTLSQLRKAIKKVQDHRV